MVPAHPDTPLPIGGWLLARPRGSPTAYWLEALFIKLARLLPLSIGQTRLFFKHGFSQLFATGNVHQRVSQLLFSY